MKTIGKKIQPVATAPPSSPAEPEAVLGSLSGEAPTDKAVAAQAKSGKVSRRKAQPVPDAPDDPSLSLPKGAVVIMRKSGGLRFTLSEVIVHRDGRVSVSTTDAVASRGVKGKPRKLTAKQVSELKVVLAKSGLGEEAQPSRRQNPDAYAYEIVALVGRRVQTAEVLDGSIPEGMQPLIRQLSGYL